MNGFAYACGYTVFWFRTQADAAASHQANWARMIAGEIPANSVGPLELCTAAEAEDWARPHNPSGDWRPSLSYRRIGDS